MKVTAAIDVEDKCVNVRVDYTHNGEVVFTTMHFPFTQNVEGTKTILMTDEALQDIVAYINNVQDT